MSEVVFNTRIINRHDTVANWEKYPDFKPKAGEFVIYEDAENGQSKIKVGNGTATVSELPYVLTTGLEISETVDELHEGVFFANADLLKGRPAEDFVLKEEAIYAEEVLEDAQVGIFYTNADLLDGKHADDFVLAEDAIQIGETEQDFVEGIYYTNADLLDGKHASDFVLTEEAIRIGETEQEFVEGVFLSNANLLGGRNAEEYALKEQSVALDNLEDIFTNSQTTVNVKADNIKFLELELTFDNNLNCHIGQIPQNINNIFATNISNINIFSTNFIYDEQNIKMKLFTVENGFELYQNPISIKIYYY